MQRTASLSPSIRLGRALVIEGILTQNQLRYALQVQQDSIERKRLGDILLDLGYVTKRQLREVTRKYGHRVQIGALLVESGAITREQLNQALEDQKTSRRPLCDVLLANKAITEEQLAVALSKQLDYPFVVPNKRLVDRGLLKKFPSPFLRQHSVLPLSCDGEITTVLMYDPLDDAAVSMLEQLLGGKYEIVVAPKRQIDRVLGELLDEMSLLAQSNQTGEADATNTNFRRYDLQRERPDLGPEGQVINIVDYLLSNAVKQRASDIHIESMYNRLRVRHRIDGKLQFETDLPAHLADRIVRRIKVLAGIDVTDSAEVFDGHIYVSLDSHNIDLRVSLFPSVLGTSITIRALTRDIGLKDLADLGMLPRVHSTLRQVLDAPAGMILFAGPTGAGKTTSLYSCLNYLNTGAVKICTIESPVEFPIEGIAQCQMKAGAAVSELVRAMMRQDPDVIVLGEVNDAATADAAVQAALSGHKVMTTIHADDTFGSVMRLMEMGLRTYMLSSTGVTAISQRLVRQICPHCKEPYTPPRKLFRQFRLRDTDPDLLEFFHGRGCEHCSHLGFFGRTGVFEILTMDMDIRNSFLSNSNALEVRKIAEQAGKFLSLREAGFIAALRGQTTLEEVMGILSFSEQQAFSEMNLTRESIEYWTGLDEEAE
jgi:type IV pilus assembly protein PilB